MLPDEVWLMVLDYLESADIYNFLFACKSFYAINNEMIWDKLCQRMPNYRYFTFRHIHLGQTWDYLYKLAKNFYYDDDDVKEICNEHVYNKDKYLLIRQRGVFYFAEQNINGKVSEMSNKCYTKRNYGRELRMRGKYKRDYLLERFRDLKFLHFKHIDDVSVFGVNIMLLVENKLYNLVFIIKNYIMLRVINIIVPFGETVIYMKRNSNGYFITTNGVINKVYVHDDNFHNKGPTHLQSLDKYNVRSINCIDNYVHFTGDKETTQLTTRSIRKFIDQKYIWADSTYG